MNSIYSKLYIPVLFLFAFLLKAGLLEAQTFSSSNLQGADILTPTSLQFGPDSNLYVAQQDGTIKVFTINRAGGNNFVVTDTQEILLVKQIPNHFDDGTPKPYNGGNKRQVTGLLVAGTASDPVIYVSSSDSDIGAGEKGDVNLCTNSGIISKLYRENGQWKKIDLVRGLPRSEENHSPNGMQLYGDTLFIAIGGFTNAGAPSKLWTFITEYALSAAILSVDLETIEAMPTRIDETGNHPYKYDLPTLDDPTRENNPDGTDVNDPWGGNDGLNQAKIDPNGPVQIFASGFRNAYDFLITRTPGRENRMYTIDNGPNRNWGGWPLSEGPSGSVTNDYPDGEPGSLSVTNTDGLEYIGNITNYVPGSYYGGHPCPVRANPEGAGLYTNDGTNRVWRTSKTDPEFPLPADWPPLPLNMANPIEADFQGAGIEDNSLITIPTSTNGFCEYKASGSLQGDLLAAGFDGNIYRIRMDAFGNVLNMMDDERVNQDPPFATGFGTKPLDIIAQGDNEIFPGTIWVATWGSAAITVFEPQEVNCVLADPDADDDGDGYKNGDEQNAGTDPCSGTSKPGDFDEDLISNITDTDDDNDGIPDVQDYFQIGPENGLTTTIPTHYNLYNYDPGTGFYGLGFTGLMCNKTSEYLDLFDENIMIAGGAVGALTIEEIPAGDALGSSNDQMFAFQFGINVNSSTQTFTVKSGILPQYFGGTTPQDDQSQGIFIGTGDQDNYIKIALNSNGGSGGIEVVYEKDGVESAAQYELPNGIPNSSISFYLTVNPANGTVIPKYSIEGKLVTLGSPITAEGSLLEAFKSSDRAMAVGIIATSRNATPFNATWDFVEVYPGSTITAISYSNDFEIPDKIAVYPNPAYDKITISAEELQGRYKVKLVNPAGNEIAKFSFGRSQSSGKELDVSGLEEGIYYLQFINTKSGLQSAVKFIKH